MFLTVKKLSNFFFSSIFAKFLSTLPVYALTTLLSVIAKRSLIVFPSMRVQQPGRMR